MTVRIKYLSSPGSSLQLSFSDNFTRADAPDWGSNWLTMYQFLTTAGAGTRFATPSLVSNRGQINNQLQGGGGSTIINVSIPLPVFGNLSTQSRIFSQCTWQTGSANLSTFLAIQCRSQLTGGTGGGGFGEMYICRLDRGLGGQVQKFLGSGLTQLRAATWTNAAAGDVFEIAAAVSSSAVTLQIFKNGLQDGADIVDSSASRITTGGPGIGGDPSNAAGNGTFSAYSCGIF